MGLGLFSAIGVFHNTQDEPRVWILIFNVMEKNVIAIVKQNAGYLFTANVTLDCLLHLWNRLPLCARESLKTQPLATNGVSR